MLWQANIKNITTKRKICWTAIPCSNAKTALQKFIYVLLHFLKLFEFVLLLTAELNYSETALLQKTLEKLK